VLSQRLDVFTKFSNQSFESSPGCEVTGPVAMLDVGIGEEIVDLGWVGVALFLNDVNVFTGGGVFDGHSELSASCVNVVYQFIYVFEPDVSIDVMEVFSQCVH
jgi:hypothetical protein